MSLGLVMGLGLLGGAGAVGRLLLDAAVSARAGRAFPLGTLAVNLSGALALGVLTGLALGADASRLLAAGLVGSYTTFSTWAFESHRLGEDGRGRAGLANLVLSLALGLAAVWVGRRIGTAL